MRGLLGKFTVTFTTVNLLTFGLVILFSIFFFFLCPFSLKLFVFQSIEVVRKRKKC